MRASVSSAGASARLARVRATAPLTLVLALLLAACSSDEQTADTDSGSTHEASTQKAQSQPKPQPKPEAKPKAKSYRERVADCAEDALFKTRDAGNALRVESPAGRPVANVQVFNSRSEAADFAQQLEVPHASAGKGVAVWLAGGSDSDQAVVTDCLRS